MRFKRTDLPGLIVATVGPVLLMFLLLDAYQLWEHHGSPILGILSVNLAIGGGIIGAFSRFIKARIAVLGLLGVLIAVVAAVLLMQATGNDGGFFASALKIIAVLMFLVLNVVVVWQFLVYGVNPLLVRRDERAAAAAEEQA